MVGVCCVVVALVLAAVAGVADAAQLVWGPVHAVRYVDPANGNATPVQSAVGPTGRALIVSTGGGPDQSNIEAVLATTGGRLDPVQVLATDANLGGSDYEPVKPVVDAAGNSFVLWKQLRSRRLMLAVARHGHRFAPGHALNGLTGALAWELAGSRAGPVTIEWVTGHGGVDRLFAARVGPDGRLAGTREIASGAVGQQSVATNDRGDLAVMWAPANTGSSTNFTFCPVGGRCRTEGVPVVPMFAAVALAPNGSVLVAGAVSKFGDGIQVSRCALGAACAAPQVLSRTGLFPTIVVDALGRATVTWEDEQSSDGYLSSAVLDAGSEQFSSPAHVRVRIGGVLAWTAGNAPGAVIAAWQPDAPPSSPMVTAFAAPGQRLRAATRVSAGRPRQRVIETSDPAVGIDDHGNAILSWSAASLTGVTIDVSFAHELDGGGPHHP